VKHKKRNFDQEAFSWDENPVRVKLAEDVASAIRREITLIKNMDVLIMLREDLTMRPVTTMLK